MILSLWIVFVLCASLPRMSTSNGNVEEGAVEGATVPILDFLRNAVAKFQLGTQTDLILLLGNTGSGKSTLASFLAGVDLEAIETFVNSAEFVIIDRLSDRISGNSTIKSKTIMPEMLIDVETNATYFDCPGFSDTRSVEYDLTATYLNKKLLEHAQSVKFVFLVNYASVRRAGDRSDFIEMAVHATNLIRNIPKYRNGIMLVVTKVDNEYSRSTLVTDDIIVQRVAAFLHQAKVDVSESLKQSQKDQKSISAVIELIDIILEKQDNAYKKIALFRRADQSGPIKEIPILRTERNLIKEIINSNLEYIATDKSDFGYTLSEKSKNRVNDLMVEIQNSQIAKMKDFSDDIVSFYLHQDEKLSDIAKLQELYSLGHQQFSKIQLEESSFQPQTFIDEILDATFVTGYYVPEDYFANFLANSDFENFLIDFSNGTSTNSILLTKQIDKLQQHVSNALKWYDFLKDLQLLLSGFDVQKRQHDELNVTALSSQCSIDKNGVITVSDIGLEQFLHNVDPTSVLYRTVKDLRVNFHNLAALRSVLQQTLMEGVSSTCVHNKLIVQGMYVKLSDVIKSECYAERNEIEIFAFYKVFIDTDLDKTGREAKLSIIAPNWEIIDGRQIILNGQRRQYDEQSNFGRRGQHGKPGCAGGSAGHFFGIGNTFNNDMNLKVFANGGRGCLGQNGVGGVFGISGVDPIIIDSSNDLDGIKKFYEREGFNVKMDEDPPNNVVCVLTVLLSCPWKATFTVYGKKAISGGPGGDGGAGGLGGNAGEIVLIGLHHEPKFNVYNAKGETGIDGYGMLGSPELPDGRTLIADYSFDWSKLRFKLEAQRYLSTGVSAPAGRNGRSGKNRVGIESPHEVEFQDTENLVNSYTECLESHLIGNVIESELRTFLVNLTTTVF